MRAASYLSLAQSLAIQCPFEYGRRLGLHANFEDGRTLLDVSAKIILFAEQIRSRITLFNFASKIRNSMEKKLARGPSQALDGLLTETVCNSCFAFISSSNYRWSKSQLHAKYVFRLKHIHSKLNEALTSYPWAPRWISVLSWASQQRWRWAWRTSRSDRRCSRLWYYCFTIFFG